MKLSYILSIVVGISAFCLLLFGLDLNVIFSLIVSVIAYYACTMIFKEKSEMQVELDSDFVEYQKVYSGAWSIIRKIQALEKEIDDPTTRSNIKQICDLSQKILETLKENPNKTSQVRKFVDYYLPFTLNIIEQYNTVEDKGLTSDDSKAFMAKAERMIEKVEEACESQLNNMYKSDIVNTNADIKVFETMLKSDGLVDDNMNIKVEKKEGE